MNKDEFIESIEEYPHWVKTKNDALSYARHINYRLIQTKSKYDLLHALIKEKDPKFVDNEMLLKLLEVHNEYDVLYNDYYHPELSDYTTAQNLQLVKQ